MIDFHTHVLPGIDDGSKNAAESIEMLRALHAQGVEKVVATPHFYPEREDVPAFCSRRAAAFKRLAGHADLSGHAEGIPIVHTGAEVAFYEGLSSIDGIRELAIDGTNLLLVEMPTRMISRRELHALCNVPIKTGLDVIVAHVDRLLGFKGNNQAIQEMRRNGLLLQLNCESIISIKLRRTTLGMIKRKEARLLGTDCHNLTIRKPNMRQALDIIQRRLGTETVEQLAQFGSGLLK